MELFRRNGTPTDKHWYLFNGDFVDRGSWSTEIALLLYAYKWLRPHGFFLNRGNHETDDMNRVYGFEGECKAKYNERYERSSTLIHHRPVILTAAIESSSSSPRVSLPYR
jgi:serine/threonine-protein phosphatase 5